MKMSAAFAALVLCAFAVQDESTTTTTDPKPGTLSIEDALKTITAKEVGEHITWLADDKRKGRDTPSPELEKTAEYVSERFKEAGLKPIGDDDTFIRRWEFRGKKVPNCIGLLEGSDEKLKKEYVYVGGHMDHVGARGGTVYNGADDNASGTTGVLELAEAFGSLKVRPKRSIVFMTFGGEEKGLLGSRAYCNDPVFPMEDTVAMINLDMIGRSIDNYLFVGGVGTSPVWPDMIKKYNETYKFDVETSPGGRAPSDNTNFYNQGMPVLFFFTNVHPDYHLPGDDAEKINTEAEEKIIKMAFQVLHEVADMEKRPEFTRNNAQALPKNFGQKMRERSGGGAARNRVILGVNLEQKGTGVEITSVREDSAADEAGLKEGDTILKIGDKDVETRADVRKALRAFKPGDKTTITVLRDGEEEELKVRFPK